MNHFVINGKVYSDREISSRLEQSYQAKQSTQITNGFKRASVLILLVMKEDETCVLFTRRTEKVLDHKGQVAFPGGAKESQDADDIGTAIRETIEEIGIDPKEISILGRLPELTTISRYIVSPIIGWIRWPVELSINPSEVDQVFLTPISWLVERNNSNSQRILVRDGVIERLLIFKPYKGNIIWGITARLTCSLIKTLGFHE